MKPISEQDKPSLLSNQTFFAEITIAICDPDIYLAALVKNILSTLGCARIFVVADGQSLLDLMKEEKIDIIITDWQTKNLSGIDITTHLRQSLDSMNRMIPIIMLTARTGRHDIQTARDAGITEYIVKPFSAKTLLDRVYSVVKDPRSFILCKTYIGPDRRRISSMTLPPNPDENHKFFERKSPVIVPKEALQQIILDDTPRMILPDYSLKKKIGFDVPDELIINPLSIAKSEEEIGKMQAQFVTSMLKDLDALHAAYALIIHSPDNLKTSLKTIKDSAASIKARAGVFGYTRASEVANQLYNFCQSYYDKDNAHHLIIIEKHIQTISVIFAQKITGDGGDTGRELMIDLARLINKYLNRKE